MPTAPRPGTKTDRLVRSLRDRIAARALGPGDRMPSIRGLAAQMQVSPSTVVEAYDRLTAEGLLQPRRGAGFFVTRAAQLPPLRVAAMEPTRPRDLDPFWVSRQSLDPQPGALQPGCGWMPGDWLPEAAMRSALRALARAETSVLTDYAPARGCPRLRRLLLARCAEEHLALTPDQLMLTASASQAMDLICRLLLRPGDTVLVDDPGYFNFHALLRSHQVRVVGLPRTPEGPDLAAFEAALAQGPRLYLTNSALHNPTGGTLSPQIAQRLLTLAAGHPLTIVEDETFADLEPEPSVRLAVLDGLERVLRIGGFSKTLSASVRCGYIAGRADWIEALTDLQVATSFGGPSPVATEVLRQVLAQGGYRRHLAQLHRRLARARRQAVAQLAPLGITPWVLPRGGFYLWTRFPEGCDTGEVARAAAARNVILAPGNVFSPGRTAGRFMRFNVTQMSDPAVLSALHGAMT
ncbi:PLP-dependent aminotransferase family protein [Pseudooceanicola sp. CBS1P-1]|uniref:Aminotransferase class I/II-fold pyridoxal phosphate-dependent enzyme n=1 Tax=Pseudooceanicola albus TaxID=2692189 RepID=A0A6L7G5A3_9RHOB|nr:MULTISPECIES: PLP-dependent aminotransferase family protein [Pseudooceanicola]MBT9385238.1 PLP-dependent aminotransferase family protein [Pseudooceanicola endophyticus]MXN18678.1 aminotransferase class I/II-fold pyridoxal phosphate-dependent enzyme [Pseudooceanicola albus]